MGTTGGDSGDGPVYNFFRNLRSFFGIPHRLEPGDKNRRDKALRIPSPDLYDDTNYADPNSFVQEYESRSNNSGASQNDNMGEGSPAGPGGRFPFEERGFKNDQEQFDPFGFGNVFGQMDAFFSEMEKEFAGMSKHFGGFGSPDRSDGGGDERLPGFGLFNDPVIDRDETGTGEGQDNDRRLVPYSHPNLRGEVLKPGNDDKLRDECPTESSPGDSSITEVQPSPSFSWRSGSSKFSKTFSSDGKGFQSQAYSQTIRDTPKGREITTFRQNPDGTTEKSTEFIPREDLPKEALDAGQLQPFGFRFMRDFFRPKM